MEYILMSTAFSLIAFVIFRVNRGIPEFLSVRDVLKIAQAVFVAGLMTGSTLFITTRLQDIGRSVPVIHALILGAGLFSLRLFAHILRHRQHVAARAATPAICGESVILIGINKLAVLYMRLVEAMERPRQTIVALLDEDPGKTGRTVGGVRVYGSAADLERIIEEFAVHGIAIDRVMLGDKNVLSQDARAIIEDVCLQRGIDLGIIPEVLGIDRLSPREKPLPSWLPNQTGALGSGSTLPAYARHKRAISLAVVVPLIVLLSPLILITAFAAFMDVGSPIFFWQQRVGLNGRTFSIYKVRTLHNIYDRRGRRVPEERRLSRTGRVLRKLRLDELPQLLNVLVGDMALIGPRPLLFRDQPSSMSRRLAIRPGITGWAQVNGGTLLSAEEKGALDDWYVAHMSARLDIRIVLLTLRSMLFGDRRKSLVTLGHARANDPVARPRIAFVNRYFHPDQSATSQILTDLALHLAGEGLDIHVFTSQQRYDQAGAMLPETGFVDGVAIHRLKTTRFGRISIVGRAFDYLTFYTSARRALLAWGRVGDVLVTKTDPPLLGVLGSHVAKQRGMRLVNWLQDLYPEIAAELGVPFTRGVVGRYMLGWRDASLKAAVANVVVGQRMAERVLSRGISPEQVHVIPNWAGDENIRPIAHSANPLRKAWQLDGHFVVGYSGNLGRGHEFETILAAAELLRHEPLLLFLFISNSPKIAALREAVHARGLDDRFRFLPPQDRAKLPYSLGVADVHLISMQASLEGLMVPSKVYGIAAAGRPFIAITARDGEVASLALAHRCGLVVEPGAASTLAENIGLLMSEPDTLADMGRHARAMLDAHFTRRVALERWSRLFHNILQIEPSSETRPLTRSFRSASAAAAAAKAEIEM
jgi:lipopolysaccharide/colanic/teichoic acid biosynthesis glycosyltransferase/glycosyltransferase involved in cell wall biosynthesis